MNIRVSDLGVCFRAATRPALSGVSFQLPAGSVLGVAGLNGSGKTTLALALRGFARSIYGARVTGRIEIDGEDISQVSPAALLGRIGLVHQNPFSQLCGIADSVADEIAFGLENLGTPMEKIEEEVDRALLSVDAAGLKARAPLSLSGGQAQRVAIASVLALQPSVLLLDEPTSQLDPAGAAELFQLLDRLKQDGRTLIVAEHRFDLLAPLVDVLMVLDEGKVLHLGPPGDVLAEANFDRTGLKRPLPAEISYRRRLKKPGHRKLAQSVSEIVEELRRDARPREASMRVHAPPPDPSSPAFFEVKNLRFRYPKMTTPALDGVSFRMEQAGSVALLGRNGSGKTTLSRLLCGLLPPEPGTIIAHAPVVRTGYLFQNPDDQLFLASVRAELAFGLTKSGRSRADSESVIDGVAALLELTGILDLHPGDLGAAERKLVALGVVLTLEPNFVILDEPTSGLDERQRRRLRRALTELRRRGAATLIITHDLAFALEHCPRSLVLDRGRLVADDDTSRLVTNGALLAEHGLIAPALTEIGHAVFGASFRTEDELFRALDLPCETGL